MSSITVRQPRVAWAAALLLAWIPGCGSNPVRSDLAEVVDVPEEWALDGALAESAPFEARLWWSDFGDSQLDELVEEALEHNHDLAAAAARVDAARARADIAGAARMPTVGAGYGFNRQRQNFVGFPIPGAPAGQVLSTQSTAQGVSLDVTWEADLWGRLAAAGKAALAEAGASEVDLRAARLSLAARTTSAWLGLIEAHLQLELAQETADSYRANVDLVRRRYRAGRADPLDLRLLESDLASSEALIEARRQGFAQARRQLELLLGRYPEGAVTGAADLPSMPEPVPAGLPSELLLRRPDLEAASLRLVATDYRLAEARAELYPSLTLTGSFGRRSVDLDDLFDSTFDVWSIAAGLLQPIYAGGRIRAGIDLADAEVRTVLASYAQSVLRAFAEVEGALVSESMLEQREARLQTASDQAVSAQSMAQDRYQSGLVDVVTVLTAQRLALGARSRLLEVRRARLQNRVDLHLALGGDFDKARPSAVQPGDGPETEERQ
ncbi:MAG: multidrug efflux system outer membrane protein [Chlamydiales bacterium]